jgi:RimJ/RimL family protein N-acetyltransferase
MSDRRSGWPSADPEGRPVNFTSREPRPRPDEFTPTLEGRAVRLEPMRTDHLDDLCRACLDPDISRLLPRKLETREDMTAYVLEALAARQALRAIPFVTVLAEQGRPAQVVGTTRFLSIDAVNRRLEIGATMIGKQWQRTRVNTEAKYLMLRHAFETLQCIRVEFKTDSLNERSRAALVRIGAVQEGVFRNHMIVAEGRIRHSVYFGITSAEWPQVKAKLERMLAGSAS